MIDCPQFIAMPDLVALPILYWRLLLVLSIILVSHFCVGEFSYFTVEQKNRGVEYEINYFLRPLISYATYVPEQEIFVVDLGGFCNGSYNCRASYTECNNNICSCLDGFTPTEDLTCKTTRLYCPNLEGDVPRPLDPQDVKPCYKLAGQNDTTPCSTASNSSREFCFLYPLTRTGQNAQVGHCCPKPGIGSKISYGVCPVHPSLHPDMACPGCYEFGEQCVAFRHWSSANSYSFNSQCCPFPCQTTMTYDMISVDGICYLDKYVGESCRLNVQCKTANSICSSSGRNDGTCRCTDGHSPNVRPTPIWQKVSKRTTCVKN